MRVVGLAAPAVLILRAVVDQQQQAGRGQTVDEQVEEGLRFRVDPVQVFKDQQQRLRLALAQQQALEGLEGALAALRRIEFQERAVGRQHVQQRQQCRQRVLEGVVQRQHLPGQLGAQGAHVIAILNVGIVLEQLDHWEVGGGLAVGHRGTLQHQPPLRVMGMENLIDQARLANTGFANHGHHLAVCHRGQGHSLPDGLKLCLSAHEARQAARCRRLQAAVHSTGT